jgi:hypothetical protein
MTTLIFQQFFGFKEIFLKFGEDQNEEGELFWGDSLEDCNSWRAFSGSKV